MPIPPNLIRSTILKPLGVALSMLLSATILAFYLKLPLTLGIVLGTFAGITLALYLIIYVLAFRRDPELLRSEKHSIQKLAIEKGFVGDSLQGTFDIKTMTKVERRLPQSQEGAGESEQ